MAKLLKALAHPETSSLWATTIRSRLERAPCRLVGPANPAPKHRARNARGEARKLGQAGGYRENDRLSVPGRLPGQSGLGQIRHTECETASRPHLCMRTGSHP